jgi:hypothetical protein
MTECDEGRRGAKKRVRVFVTKVSSSVTKDTDDLTACGAMINILAQYKAGF